MDSEKFDLLSRIAANTALSATTKRNYELKTRQLATIVGHPPEWIVSHPNESLRALRKSAREATTLRTYVSIVLGLFKHNPDVSREHAEARDAWRDAYREIDVAVQDKYDTMKASPRQLQAHVPWNEIERIRDEDVDKTSPDHLVLSCYTMIPPVRADLGAVRIVRRHDEIAIAEHPNYLLVDRVEEEENARATKNNEKTMTLVLTEFKTDASMHVYREVLPPALRKVIRDSLRRRPRDFLLVSPGTGRPFEDPRTFSNYVARVLKRTLGTPHASLNMLRHSYVTSLDLNRMTSKDMKATADKLMHSVETMLRYRLDVSSKKEGATTCEVTCRRSSPPPPPPPLSSPGGIS